MNHSKWKPFNDIIRPRLEQYTEIWNADIYKMAKKYYNSDESLPSPIRDLKS